MEHNPSGKSGAEKVEGGVGKSENLAAIRFLAAEESRFIIGTTLVVDEAQSGIL